MNRGCKIALTIFGLLFVLGVGALVAAGFWLKGELTNPNAGSEIVQYSLPAGYRQIALPEMAGTKMIMIMPADMQAAGGSAMMVMLFGFPAGTPTDDAGLKQMSDQMTAQMAGGQVKNLKQVAKKPVKIAGQSREMIVQQGTSSAGQPIKMGMILFKSNSGNPACVMFMATPDTAWDNKIVDEFLKSTGGGPAGK